MRTFLAFEIDQQVQKKVVETTNQFKTIDSRVRWVKPENTHVTVRFFGEVHEGNIAILKAVIEKAVKGISPFSVEVAGISAFPSLDRARVIWYGVENHIQLQAVYNRIGDGLRENHIVEKLDTRSYTPHLTAGRVKGQIRSDLIREIRLHEKIFFGTSLVRAFILFKSTLSNSGPVYEKLSNFTF
jgi:2'-5' RNA ligase